MSGIRGGITPGSPYSVVDNPRGITVDSIEAVMTQPPTVADISIEADIALFSFSLFLPGGETQFLSSDFTPYYGSNRKVWAALQSGALTIDDAHAEVGLLKYIWDKYPEKMALIPSVAFMAKQLGW